MILENDIFKRISSNLIIFENINHIFKIIMDNEYNVEKDINSNSNNNTNNSYDPKKYIKSKLLKNKAKNYEHTFIRNTNTFGKVPVEREQKFNNIKRSNGSIVVDAEKLSKLFDFINWKLYFEIKFEFYGITQKLEYIGLYLQSPNVIKQIDNIIQETDIKIVTTYMEWIVTVYLFNKLCQKNLIKLILKWMGKMKIKL